MPTDIGGRSKIKETTQEMLNQSFDEKYNIPVVEVVEEDTSVTPNILRRAEANTPKAMKFTEIGNTTYIAFSSPGTAQSTAKWRAMKIDESSGGTTITWADGDGEFNNQATDLTSLSYS